MEKSNKKARVLATQTSAPRGRKLQEKEKKKTKDALAKERNSSSVLQTKTDPTFEDKVSEEKKHSQEERNQSQEEKKHSQEKKKQSQEAPKRVVEESKVPISKPPRVLTRLQRELKSNFLLSNSYSP